MKWQHNSSLLKRLNEIYDTYGYYLHKIDSFEFEGLTGMQKMADIMAKIRANTPKEIAGHKVVSVDDFETQVSKNIENNTQTNITLPKSNMLIYKLKSQASVIVRPSGTVA